VLWVWVGDDISSAIDLGGGDLQGPAWPEPPKPRRRRILEGVASVERARERLGTCADVLERHGHHVRGRMGWCPFHQNHRSPALSLFERDGTSRFRCHACDAHGDALDLEAQLAGEDLATTIRRWGR
jgi:hypothetical protein